MSKDRRDVKKDRNIGTKGSRKEGRKEGRETKVGLASRQEGRKERREEKQRGKEG